MPFEALCPTCGASYTLRDEMRGKNLRCKKCEHPFVAGGGRRESRDDEDDDRPDERVQRRAPARDDDIDDRPRRRPAARDDDDDDRDDRPRPRPKSGSGNTKVVLLVGAAAGFGLMLIVCGCLGYLIANADGGGGAAFNDPNGGNPFPNAPPAVGKKPENLDQAVTQLRAAGSADRRAAADFVAQAALDPARQTEVAKALEALLGDGDQNVKNSAFLALKTWATKDSAPALAQALDKEKLFVNFNEPQTAAVDTLARLKDERGAAAIARFLPDHFCREKAAAALATLGPAAEKAVLAFHNYKDTQPRDEARRLLRGYGTKPEAILAQCLTDLRGPERAARQAAAEWLATATADETQRAAVAQALDPLLAEDDQDVTHAACKALLVWATPTNVAALERLAGDQRSFRRREAIAALGRIKDPRVIPALAKLLEGHDRNVAADALLALGPSVRDAVLPYLSHDDGGVRNEAKRVLTGVGVKDNLPLLQAVGDLKSNDAGRRAEAARLLERTKVDEARRAEIATALDGAAGNTADKGAQEAAVRALRTWGSKESVPALLPLLNDLHPPLRHATCETLAKLKDERAVKGLAARLLHREDRNRAAQALTEMGPDFGVAIEAEVRTGLALNDADLNRECVKILGAVGTKASVKDLTTFSAAAVKARRTDLVNEAQAAIAAINARAK